MLKGSKKWKPNKDGSMNTQMQVVHGLFDGKEWVKENGHMKARKPNMETHEGEPRNMETQPTNKQASE